MTERRGMTIRRIMVVIACVAFLLGGLMWVLRSGAWSPLTEAFELSAYFYPRLAWAAGAGVLVALISGVIDARVWRIRSLSLLPLAIPAAVLAYGLIFAYDNTPDTVIEERKQVLEWLPWLQVPVGIALLACFRSVAKWLIVVGLSFAAAWLALRASILSWMSVTSLWL